MLDTTLGFEKLIDLSAQGLVFSADNFFDNHFESERSITDPGVEVVRVDGTWACDDDPGLADESFASDGHEAWDLRRSRRTSAPDDFEPSEPMLAKRPDLAIWDSPVMYDSTVSEDSPKVKVM